MILNFIKILFGSDRYPIPIREVVVPVSPKLLCPERHAQITPMHHPHPCVRSHPQNRVLSHGFPYFLIHGALKFVGFSLKAPATVTISVVFFE